MKAANAECSRRAVGDCTLDQSCSASPSATRVASSVSSCATEKERGGGGGDNAGPPG